VFTLALQLEKALSRKLMAFVGQRIDCRQRAPDGVIDRSLPHFPKFGEECRVLSLTISFWILHPSFVAFSRRKGPG
jgi:hypothetical protein